HPGLHRQVVDLPQLPVRPLREHMRPHDRLVSSIGRALVVPGLHPLPRMTPEQQPTRVRRDIGARGHRQLDLSEEGRSLLLRAEGLVPLGTRRVTPPSPPLVRGRALDPPHGYTASDTLSASASQAWKLAREITHRRPIRLAGI